jgi:hypothetical protein
VYTATQSRRAADKELTRGDYMILPTKEAATVMRPTSSPGLIVPLHALLVAQAS